MQRTRAQKERKVEQYTSQPPLYFGVILGETLTGILFASLRTGQSLKNNGNNELGNWELEC